MEEERVVFARRADDMHHHLRDGDALSVTVPAAARQFQRVIAMPNLTPPITTTEMALAYRERILSQVPIQYKDSFTPLMTLYMTDETTCDEIRKAHDSKCIHAVKYYPAGATTNSAHGVTDMKYIYDVLHVMTEIGMPLLIHGEVTDNNIDIFDREATCISTVLQPLVLLFPDLKIVMEHITTSEGVAFVQNTNNVAATITPQHLLYNRNVLFQGGLRPHKYCLPVLKRESHRLALVAAIQSGSSKFFLGTDSAPHVSHKKENACGCAGIYSSHAALELYATAFMKSNCLDLLEAFATQNASLFYGLPFNPKNETILTKTTWTVPASYPFEDGQLIPLGANELLEWTLE